MKKSFFLSVLVVVFAVVVSSCGGSGSKDELSSAKEMISFTVDGEAWVLQSDTWVGPAEALEKGTTTWSKTPVIVVSEKADYSPKTAQNLVNKITFTVTAEDGTTKTYYAQAKVKTE